MPEEIVSGIYRLPIPLPDNPLGSVNAYAVLTDDGVRLVDCGWNTPEAYEALDDGLRSLGTSIRDIREIVVTHIHPDHFGLAERLVGESHARVIMHELEAMYVGARYKNTEALVNEMQVWLRLNGLPADELAAAAQGSLMMLKRVGTRSPDILLQGGEILRWGPYRFEVLWTPGHSAGLVCLYEQEAQILISSDHVLERVSPHVGLHVQSLGNPLDDYLSSLEAVRSLPTRIILPGHAKPFSDLESRVDALFVHHRERFGEILSVMSDGYMSANMVARQLSWRRSKSGWQILEPFQRRMALIETVAHLEHLYGRGDLAKRRHAGVVQYCRRRQPAVPLP